MFIKLDFFFQNFVIDLIWYCVRFFFGYAGKKKIQHVPVDIVVGRNVAGQNFKIPVTFMRSRKISGRGYKLCPTLVMPLFHSCRYLVSQDITFYSSTSQSIFPLVC